jgi:hypothetical protein
MMTSLNYWQLTLAITGGQKQSEAELLHVRVDGVVGRHISYLRITSPTSEESHEVLHYFFAI